MRVCRKSTPITIAMTMITVMRQPPTTKTAIPSSSATMLKPDSQVQPGSAPAVGKTESKADQIALARMKGYEGESCPECGNFTMVRNGTCLKCDTCGATSGCS